MPYFQIDMACKVRDKYKPVITTKCLLLRKNVSTNRLDMVFGTERFKMCYFEYNLLNTR